MSEDNLLCGFCKHPKSFHYDVDTRKLTNRCDALIHVYNRFNLADNDRGYRSPFTEEYCNCIGYTEKQYSRWKNITIKEIDLLLQGLYVLLGDKTDATRTDNIMKLVNELRDQIRRLDYDNKEVESYR